MVDNLSVVRASLGGRIVDIELEAGRISSIFSTGSLDRGVRRARHTRGDVGATTDVFGRHTEVPTISGDTLPGGLIRGASV
jgi:hypothetical protein